MSVSRRATRKSLQLLLGDFNEHAWWIMGKYRKNVYEYVKKNAGKKIYKKKTDSPLKSREGNWNRMGSLSNEDELVVSSL